MRSAYTFEATSPPARADNRPLAGSKRAAARRGGACVAAAEVVDHGRGALGAAVEADMRSRGEAQAGKGLGAHLEGRGGGRMRRTHGSRGQDDDGPRLYPRL